MSKSPNAEQLLAIQHTGGVLLKAGAGSGKTFVLVEHIVYLTSLWIKEFHSLSEVNFEDFIRKKYSQVVMMTFTKKAAGEMNIRLVEKFKEISSVDAVDKGLWQIANETLPFLLVTTIDGFCKKLISSGYFSNIASDADIIFSAERRDQVDELLNSWLEKNASRLLPGILEVLIREKDSLLEAFCNIFNDPGLRLAWKNFSLEDSRPEKINDVIQNSSKLNNISNDLTCLRNILLPLESERSAFEKSIHEIQATGLPDIDSLDKLNFYFNFLKEKKFRPEASPKKKCLEYDKAHQARKKLKEWTSDWMPEIELYINHYESKIRPWIEVCLEIFYWIDNGLDSLQGLTFSDIEFFVAVELENKANLERIHKNYNYFIVDEFQDTSALQFKIIRSLINNDYSRLFCVGDAKQAIYGFRGGELSVFQDCLDSIPRVLSLANNYRSLREIIDFNNSFFKEVLPLGNGYDGIDAFSIDSEDQNTPTDKSFDLYGTIEVLTAKVEMQSESEKLKNEHINQLEAKIIARSIENERLCSPLKVCTVLYSKLKPSADLIKALMDLKIGFTAQFKVNLLDDPIIGVFLCLLRRQFDSDIKTKNKYPLYLINSYLNILQPGIEIFEKDLERFDLNIKYWGLLEGFRKFWHELGLTNENSDINMHVIETIISIYHQNAESVMVQLLRGDNDRISLELRTGDNSHMVQIMSAHASKGLEFDTVYVGGIYTNGREKNEGSLFGNLPGSFKWFLDLSQRDKRTSPFYLYEKELNQYKSFSESKRLLYVACTRARENLKWVNLLLPEKAFSVPENSWICGFNRWLNNGLSDKLKVPIKVTQVDLSTLELSDLVPRPQYPLFFHDHMGIIHKGNDYSELSIVSELSVTRLNSLVDCPRKFYLENTLKLSGNAGSFKRSEDVDFEDFFSASVSSAQRGTYLHSQIAKGIQRNFTVPLESFSTKDRGPLEWILFSLKQYETDYLFEIEKPLKFNFFNFMISGIPDLVLISRHDQNAQIWDFKTGSISEENLKHYWVQLKAYAYSLFELGKVPCSSEVMLKLAFIDQQKILELTVDHQSCKTELYQIWHSQNEPWKINSDHCSQCPYGDICPH